MAKEMKKKMTIDGLAIMVAKGFEGVDKKFDAVGKDISELKKDVGELKKDMVEVKENVKDTRRDIFNLGDRFVSYHAFDRLSSRVDILEKKRK